MQGRPRQKSRYIRLGHLAHIHAIRRQRFRVPLLAAAARDGYRVGLIPAVTPQSDRRFHIGGGGLELLAHKGGGHRDLRGGNGHIRVALALAFQAQRGVVGVDVAQLIVLGFAFLLLEAEGQRQRLLRLGRRAVLHGEGVRPPRLAGQAALNHAHAGHAAVFLVCQSDGPQAAFQGDGIVVGQVAVAARAVITQGDFSSLRIVERQAQMQLQRIPLQADRAADGQVGGQGQRVDCAEVVALQVGIEQQLGHFLPCHLLQAGKRDLIAQQIQHHLLGL